jgi:hypothetical protein
MAAADGHSGFFLSIDFQLSRRLFGQPLPFSCLQFAADIVPASIYYPPA